MGVAVVVGEGVRGRAGQLQGPGEERRHLVAPDTRTRAVQVRTAAARDAGRGQPVDIGFVGVAVVVGEGVRGRAGQLEGSGQERRHLIALDLSGRAEAARGAASRDPGLGQPDDVATERAGAQVVEVVRPGSDIRRARPGTVAVGEDAAVVIGKLGVVGDRDVHRVRDARPGGQGATAQGIGVRGVQDVTAREVRRDHRVWGGDGERVRVADRALEAPHVTVRRRDDGARAVQELQCADGRGRDGGAGHRSDPEGGDVGRRRVVEHEERPDAVAGDLLEDDEVLDLADQRVAGVVVRHLDADGAPACGGVVVDLPDDRQRVVAVQVADARSHADGADRHRIDRDTAVRALLRDDGHDAAAVRRRRPIGREDCRRDEGHSECDHRSGDGRAAQELARNARGAAGAADGRDHDASELRERKA